MKWIALGLLFALFITMLAACETTQITETESSQALCLEDGPITFSASGDTEETVRQIRNHNAAWRALCAPRGEK